MISEWQSLRRAFLPIFARLNPGDITIKHHFTRQPFFLHSYHHKGYWYHGKRRESRSMGLYSELIKSGDTVIEIGAHIGYVAMYLSQLAGADGLLWVFEPGMNNLPYLERNLKIAGTNRNILLIPKAAGAAAGSASFYLEDLTGQNNTLLPEFDRFTRNRATHFSDHQYRKTAVEVVRVDDLVTEAAVVPSFIKVDTEGTELEVLTGLRRTLERFNCRLMVEVQREPTAVFRLLKQAGYFTFADTGSPLPTLPEQIDVGLNVFCIHSSDAHGLQVMKQVSLQRGSKLSIKAAAPDLSSD